MLAARWSIAGASGKRSRMDTSSGAADIRRGAVSLDPGQRGSVFGRAALLPSPPRGRGSRTRVSTVRAGRPLARREKEV